MNSILTRRSIRKYKDTPVSKEQIDKILEAGLYAASGRGLQSPIIIAVTDKEMRDKIAAANAAVMGASNDPFYGAPVILIVLADKTAPTYVYDGSLALGNMMLEAEELGLGTCWIHRAKQEFEGELGKEIFSMLGLKGDYEGIGHLALGYPDEKPEAKPRKEGRAFDID